VSFTSAAAAAPTVEWHAHPDVWILMMGLILAYVVAVTRLGPKHVRPGEEVATNRQKLYFLMGMALLWIGADTPIHDIAEDYLFSMHMVQHMIFTLVAPPLILMGIPHWLMRLIVSPRPVMRIVKVLTRPIVALIIFNVVVAVTHWPALVNLSVRSELAHFGLHGLVFSTALIMWWPVIDPLPGLGRLSEPGKMLYLFGQSILPTVPASFLTFANTPIYSAYAEFPRLWGISAVTDQMVAGLIMKIVGGLLLWVVIAAIFFRWHAKEDREQDESVSWEDFEQDLRVWDLRRT
jgi:putative membrane protein